MLKVFDNSSDRGNLGILLVSSSSMICVFCFVCGLSLFNRLAVVALLINAKAEKNQNTYFIIEI